MPGRPSRKNRRRRHQRRGGPATGGRAAAAHGAVLRSGRLDRAVGETRSRGNGRGDPRLPERRGRRDLARFEGHVAKFMGDGVLAYFGWPKAHEDDAERAVRAGLALVERRRRARGRRPPLAARVGIATGLVVVGELVGEGAAQEADGGRRDAEPCGAPPGARRAGGGGDQPERPAGWSAACSS